MRIAPLLLATAAAPTLALAEPVQAPPAPPPTAEEMAEAQRALADPATGAAITRMTGALSKALMDMPVGEIEAAIEGRAATDADRKRTVRDSIGSPQDVARVEQDIAKAGPQVNAMQRALAAALPGMIAAAGELEKAMGDANVEMPREGDQRR